MFSLRLIEFGVHGGNYGTAMQEKEIIKFLKEKIEPLEDNVYGTGYRASICLVDGTFLPCVIFRNSKTIVELAIRRFEEEQNGRSIVKSFVARGNCINAYGIGKIEKSKFAFPLSILKQIQGETHMGWTGFVGRMKDGECFSFGTTFLMEFFDMPEKYSVEDIDEIINHSYISKLGEIRSCYAEVEKPTDKHNDLIYRERPYFECYLDNL